MLEMVKPIAEWGAAFMEVVGISIIVLLAIYSIIYGFVLLLKQGNLEIAFREIRQRLGQGILLGLEFLVAADIIYTVAVELTFKTVGVLAIIVVIRTFLSFSLELELTGSWPWQRKE
jgi:uncharacterized membrane protein